MREQDGAAVAGGAARLLVREDAVEHLVAADGDPGGRDVRRGGQRDEDGEPDRPPAARGVDDGEDPESEEREVDGEHGREEPAVDRFELRPLDDQEQADEEHGGEAEEDEAAPSRAEVQLTGSGQEHREHTGREPAACRWEHHPSVGAGLADGAQAGK